MLDALLADGRDGRTLQQSRALATAKLDADDIRGASLYVEQHPDASAYLILFALKDADAAAYQAVPGATRAAILCDALRSLPFANDFGHLVAGLRSGEASEALVALGKPALPYLEPLLLDHRAATFFGSADATLSAQYRRCDFAFRIAARILGEPAPFDAEPLERDARIAALSRRLQVTP